MSASEVLRLKEEISKHEKILSELSKKWEEDSTLKRISKQHKPTVVNAVVSAKRLANILIPKLKFKIDLALKTPGDRRLRENATGEWKKMKPKVESTLREFEILETGKGSEYPPEEQKQRDMKMSKNIEQSLQSKRSSSGITAESDASPLSSQFPEDGRGDVGRDSTVASSRVSSARILGIGDGSEPSTSRLNNDSDYGKKMVENVRSLKDQLSKGRGHGGTLSEIVDDVCPHDAASVKQYIRSLAASEQTTGIDNILSQDMLDEIRGFDVEGMVRRKAERNKKLAKSNEIREQRIQKLEKLAEVEPVQTRPSLPTPLPIDGFLDIVETLPGEIKKLVSKETEELSEYYKNQVFMKKPPLSSHKGKLISMNKLKKEHRDDRFDASDFHIRAAESTVAEEHVKRLKEHGVDNAVGRFFGTFSSQLHSEEDEEESGSPKYTGADMELSFNNIE